MECVPFISCYQMRPPFLPAAPKRRLLREGKLFVSRLGKVKSSIVCAGGHDESSSSSTKISSAARIRSEVISPFRSVRMFFYAAFIGSGSIGALISLPRLIAALGHAANAPPATEVLMGLGVDLVAVLVFAFLYRADVKARDQQLAKISREETLAALKIELRNRKVLSLGQMRGIARLVIVVGPASHLEEACRYSEPYFSDLVERGVVVISFATDGQLPNLKFSSPAPHQDESGGQVEKLWRGSPVYTSEWTRWLKEQKQLANVPDDTSVYLSLRLDGRVRGSGTGFPPWAAFVAQLPPMKDKAEVNHKDSEAEKIKQKLGGIRKSHSPTRRILAHQLGGKTLARIIYK